MYQYIHKHTHIHIFKDVSMLALFFHYMLREPIDFFFCFLQFLCIINQIYTLLLEQEDKYASNLLDAETK